MSYIRGFVMVYGRKYKGLGYLRKVSTQLNRFDYGFCSHIAQI